MAVLTDAPQLLEKAKGKPVVVAYGAGLLVGLYYVESLIHLPLLNLARAPWMFAKPRRSLSAAGDRLPAGAVGRDDRRRARAALHEGGREPG